MKLVVLGYGDFGNELFQLEPLPEEIDLSGKSRPWNDLLARIINKEIGDWGIREWDVSDMLKDKKEEGDRIIVKLPSRCIA